MESTDAHIRKQPQQNAPVPSDQPAIRFIKRQAVETITGLSCTEIYRRIAADIFPKQVTIGPKSVVWIESEIMSWCDARIAESRGEAA